MTDTEKAEFLFDQLCWAASKASRTEKTACDFHNLSRDEKIDFFNAHVIPDFEAAGEPEPFAVEHENFTHLYWRAK